MAGIEDPLALVAGAGRAERERDSRLRLVTSCRKIEFGRQRLRTGDDSRDIRVAAGFRRDVGLTLPGFEPTTVLFLLPLLSSLFFCPLLKTRS
jgi:hypothetical protein